MTDVYKKHDLRNHILIQSPEMYIGSILPEGIDTFVVDDNNNIVRRNVTYSPALYKLFDELLVNAADHVIRMTSSELTDKHLVKNIRVDVNKDTGEVTVYNDGDGIVVDIHKESGLYAPSLIFGELLTSSNYDKSKERLTGGLNGLGVKLSIIFSTEASIKTVDHRNKKVFKQTFRENLSIKDKPSIRSSNDKPHTQVKCKFDLGRFGMTNLTDDIVGLFKRRTFEISALTQEKVNVYFNGEKVPVTTFDKFCMYFSEDKPKVYENYGPRWEIFASMSDNGFQHMSYVNSIHTRLGGRHVEYISQQIVKGLVDLATKKKKKLKPQFVKDNLFIGIKCLLSNPTYDSQTKDYMNLPMSKAGSKCEISDKFIQKLYKESGIIDRAEVLSDAKLDKEIMKTDGKKLSKVIIKGFMDAPWAGTKKSNECYLYICEGLSAQTLFTAGKTQLANPEAYGCAAIRGKLLNCKSSGNQKIASNEEIKNLKKILGLESNKVYTNTDSLRYNGIVCLVDADLDGTHIKGLITNMFQSLWPSLFKIKGFIKTMLTPIVRVKKGTNVQYFYTMQEYNTWEENTNISGWNITYLKGCGSSTSEEGKQFFRNMKMVTYTYDPETSDEAYELAFNSHLTDKRKEWIANYDKDKVVDLSNGNYDVSYTDLIHKELIHFSHKDIERNINNICDGLKESQRKLLFSLYKKKMHGTSEVKVSQMAGIAASMTAYHHGDQSLAEALIKMGQNYIGSNNINLVSPLGQFGTRLHGGGGDSAQPRYLFTRISPMCKLIFREEDMHILEYKEEENQKIEPNWFIGVIPTVFVIQITGIGTGYSTDIANFNPEEVIEQCLLVCNELEKAEVDPNVSDTSAEALLDTFTVLNKVKLHNMTPHYPNYKGIITKKDGRDNIYESTGCYRYIDESTIEITEIPVNQSIEGYKKDILDELVLDNKIKNYESYYSALNIRFLVYLHSGQKIDDPVKFFKLSSTNGLSLNNMHLYDYKNKIKKYESTSQIMREWCSVRLTCYLDRKKYKLKELDKQNTLLSAKAQFIEDIISGKIKIMHVDDSVVIERLTELKYPKMSDKPDKEQDEQTEQTEQQDTNKSYNYLLRMPVSSLTKNNLSKLKEAAEKIRVEIKTLKKTPIYNIWKDELMEIKKGYEIFKEELKKTYEDDLEALMNNGENKKKSKKKK